VLFGDEINNIVAVLMWSVSPQVGMARYHWGKAGQPGPCEEWARTKDEEATKAAYCLEILQGLFNSINLKLMDYYTYKEEHREQEAQDTLQRYQLDMANIDQFSGGTLEELLITLKEIKDINEGRELGELVIGKKNLAAYANFHSYLDLQVGIPMEEVVFPGDRVRHRVLAHLRHSSSFGKPAG